MQAPSNEPDVTVSTLPPEPAFIDKHGNKWNLELTVGVIEDVQRATGYDFDAAISKPEKLADLILQSPRKLAEILWVLCEEQANARGVTPERFGRSLSRTVIDSAADALIAAIVLFYPRASAGKALAENLPAILARMDRQMSDAVKKALSDMPTN